MTGPLPKKNRLWKIFVTCSRSFDQVTWSSPPAKMPYIVPAWSVDYQRTEKIIPVIESMRWLDNAWLILGIHGVGGGTHNSFIRAGGVLVGMRKNTVLYELLTDHLGSVTTTFPVGGAATQQRYKPWGEVRGGGNTLPTDNTYTGQKTDEPLRLIFYNARWYDPYPNSLFSSH